MKTFGLIAAFFIFSSLAANGQSNQKYLFVQNIYISNGEFVRGGYGEIFDSAEECDRYVTAAMSRIVKAVPNGAVKILGNSVIQAIDGTGWFWSGCIPPAMNDTSEYAKFSDTKMTVTRAKQLTRFPNLGE